jgi:HrpA-like RNA helicase
MPGGLPKSRTSPACEMFAWNIFYTRQHRALKYCLNILVGGNWKWQNIIENKNNKIKQMLTSDFSMRGSASRILFRQSQHWREQCCHFLRQHIRMNSNSTTIKYVINTDLRNHLADQNSAHSVAVKISKNSCTEIHSTNCLTQSAGKLICWRDQWNRSI